MSKDIYLTIDIPLYIQMCTISIESEYASIIVLNMQLVYFFVALISVSYTAQAQRRTRSTSRFARD